MTTKRTKLCIATAFMCLKFCEALFYTSSKQNDYPRIGKRPAYIDVLNKYGFSKIQSDIFTHKRGESEEFIHSLREAVVPDSEDPFDIVNEFEGDTDGLKEDEFLDAVKSYLEFIRNRQFYTTND